MLTNPASALANIRWSKASAEDRAQAGRDMHEGRAAKLTPEQRSEIAKKANLASQKARKKKARKRISKKRKSNSVKEIGRDL